MRSARDHHLLGRAFDASNVPMVLVDVRTAGHPISHCNAAFCSFTGYAEDEVVGRNCRLLQRDDRDQDGLRDLAEALAEGRATMVVLRNYRRDGSPFFNELWLAPLVDEQGIVTHYIGTLRDISDRITIEDRLRQLASTDPLTGLQNRRRFEGVVGTELRRAQRYGRPLVVMMLDLDFFKRINDEHGHRCGDAVLVDFAACLGRNLRDQDVCARVGGEEFAALLPETEIVAALKVAERLRRSVAATRTTCGSHVLNVTVSIGMTAMIDRDETYAGLFERADAALYASKENGRNRVTVA